MKSAGTAAKVLIGVAQGSEEIEAVVLADVLRRAGIETTVAKVPVNPADKTSLSWIGAQSMSLVADAIFDDVADKTWDMIIVAGGETGAKNLAGSKQFVDRVKKQKADNRWVGALSVSPAVVLAANGMLAGEKATVYPSAQAALPDQSKAKEDVVVSKKIITGRSAGCALKFALEAVGVLLGDKKKLEKIKRGIFV